jgi:uncharacterized OB-fold protein
MVKSPKGKSAADLRREEREKERQIAEEEHHLQKAQCARCGCENDEPRCLCADCQEDSND